MWVVQCEDVVFVGYCVSVGGWHALAHTLLDSIQGSPQDFRKA